MYLTLLSNKVQKRKFRKKLEALKLVSLWSLSEILLDPTYVVLTKGIYTNQCKIHRQTWLSKRCQIIMPKCQI